MNIWSLVVIVRPNYWSFDLLKIDGQISNFNIDIKKVSDYNILQSQKRVIPLRPKNHSSTLLLVKGGVELES